MASAPGGTRRRERGVQRGREGGEERARRHAPVAQRFKRLPEPLRLVRAQRPPEPLLHRAQRVRARG